jgi:hypothetical protein
MVWTASVFLVAVAAGAVPPTETFDMTLGGTPYGTEEYQRAAGSEGVVITGKVSLQVGGAGNAVLAQELKLALDGRPVSYALDIEAPGQQFVLQALPKDSGFSVSITPKGAAEPFKTAEVSAKAPVFVLDNNFASHLDALTRTLSGLGAKEERALTALVPTVLQAIPATVQRGADGRSSQGGTPVATR